MATIIKATGEEDEESLPRLRRMQEIVGGQVEGTYTLDGRRMLVNEEGLLLSLPLNQKATELAGKPIVGTAVVLTEEEMRQDVW